MSAATLPAIPEWQIWWNHLTENKRARVRVWIRGECGNMPKDWPSTKRAWAHKNIPGWWTE